MANSLYDPDTAGPLTFSSRAARSSLFLFIAKAVRYSFAFIVQLVLMNLLAPSDFGRVRYVMIIIGIFNLVNELGLSFAVVQKKDLSENELSSAFSLNVLLGAGLYILIFFLAPPFARFFGNEQVTALIRVGTFASFFGGLSVVHRSLMQRRLLFGRLAVIEVISAVIGSGGALLLATRGFGPWALLSGMFIFNILSSCALMATVTWPRGDYGSLIASNSLFGFGGAVVVQRILDYGVQNFDYLIVGKTYGEKALGIYSVAHLLMTLPQLAFGVIVGNVLLSVFSRVQDDDRRLGAAFLKVNALTSIVSAPYFVLTFSFANEMMHAVSFINHGDSWIPSAVPIKILAILGLFMTFSSYPGTIWLSKGKVRLRIFWECLALATVIIAVLWGKYWGMNGICFALVIRGIILFPVLLLLTDRVIGLSPLTFIKTLAPSIACGFGMLIFTMFFSKIIPGDSFARHCATLLIGSAGGLIIYILMFFFLFQGAFQNLSDTFLSLKKAA